MESIDIEQLASECYPLIEGGHPNINWDRCCLQEGFIAGYAHALDTLTKERDEAAEIMQTLMAYGNIRPIEGVVYPEGTHKEMLRKADEWLWRYRSAKNGG